MGRPSWEVAYDRSMKGWTHPLDTLGGRGGKDHGEGRMGLNDSGLDMVSCGDDVLALQAAADELRASDPVGYHGADASSFIGKTATELLAEFEVPGVGIVLY